MKTFTIGGNTYEIYDEEAREHITDLSEQKVDKTYIVSVFRELKQVLQGGDIDSAIAILDEAILDLSTLS